MKTLYLAALILAITIFSFKAGQSIGLEYGYAQSGSLILEQQSEIERLQLALHNKGDCI